MKKLIISLAAFVVFALTGIAVADLTVKDSGGATQTMFDFACFTTKHCSTVVLTNSAGAEISPATSAQMTALTAAVNGPLVTNDPCTNAIKSYAPITSTTAAVKVIAVGAPGKKTFICQLVLTTTAANNVAVFEATTATVCATSPAAVYGNGTTVATAAQGFPFPANGGVSMGNGGGTISQTANNNNDLCIATSAATQLTGGIMYVAQ